MKFKRDVSGHFFIGSLFLGIGFGIYFNQIVVGISLGLGLGFIIKGIFMAITKKNS